MPLSCIKTLIVVLTWYMYAKTVMYLIQLITFLTDVNPCTSAGSLNHEQCFTVTSPLEGKQAILYQDIAQVLQYCIISGHCTIV